MRLFPFMHAKWLTNVIVPGIGLKMVLVAGPLTGMETLAVPLRFDKIEISNNNGKRLVSRLKFFPNTDYGSTSNLSEITLSRGKIYANDV